LTASHITLKSKLEGPFKPPEHQAKALFSIKNITAGQASSYFRKENFYSPAEAEANSEWFGELAPELQLHEDHADEDFVRLLHSRAPNGKALTQKQPGKTHRAGIDLTASAPKSVSLAALWGGDDRLIAAHRRANEIALRALERHCAQARIWNAKQKKQVKQKTKKLVGRRFLHTTSRALDPQLHTHNIILNTTKTADGKWRALSNEEIFRDRMLYDGVYRNALAQAVQELGYAIADRTDGGFELQGYTSTQLELFSKRRQQILSEVGETATAIQRQRAALSTRSKKECGISLEELRAYWDGQNEAYRLDIVHPVPHSTPAMKSGIQRESVEQVLNRAIARCRERHTSFTSADLMKVAFARVQGFSVDDFEQEIAIAQEQGKLIQTKEERWTTEAQDLDLDHDNATPFHQLVDDYLALSSDEQAQTLILSETRQAQDTLTAKIRAGLKAQGRLGTAMQAVRLDSKGLTEIQTRYVRYIDLGDVVIPSAAYPKQGLLKGQQYQVMGKDQDRLMLQAKDGVTHTVNPLKFRKSIYRPVELEIAVGDRLRFDKCDRSQIKELIVTEIAGTQATLRHRNGKSTHLDLSQPNAVEYALVSLIDTVPEKPIDRIWISTNNSKLQNQFDVARLRATSELRIYTQPNDYESLLLSDFTGLGNRLAKRLDAALHSTENLERSSSADPSRAGSPDATPRSDSRTPGLIESSATRDAIPTPIGSHSKSDRADTDATSSQPESISSVGRADASRTLGTDPAPNRTPSSHLADSAPALESNHRRIPNPTNGSLRQRDQRDAKRRPAPLMPLEFPRSRQSYQHLYDRYRKKVAESQKLGVNTAISRQARLDGLETRAVVELLCEADEAELQLEVEQLDLARLVEELRTRQGIVETELQQEVEISELEEEAEI
jgi:conjugative relaxase-like TrwC/TraI family protein